MGMQVRAVLCLSLLVILVIRRRSLFRIWIRVKGVRVRGTIMGMMILLRCFNVWRGLLLRWTTKNLVNRSKYESKIIFDFTYLLIY